jgi:hypothetical protein
MTGNNLCTKAWLLVGMTRSIPGVLELDGGRLILTTEQEQVFDVSLTEVTEIRFPWYYFGGGLKLQIGAEGFRLSFVQPDDANDVPLHLLDGRKFNEGKAFSSAGEIFDGRRVGKAWKSALKG